ncbi:PaaX family transcriptional regulator [Actinomadura algeriensis]|uniref:Phenylacetic acid degradation operon negative regulatory protein n=1 Tax=Actinomadura algeriensis TaxID=1679523 RepID=A0ABR9JKW5_9ACTN|nr:PaaX family transcriptional regulator C-terminal domain-containing protein [Actinomadura algeriensis]MBE1531187.1 phenylacetic acid degradation operon negative regulatory protein [Actinomadura algeriensis]
MNSTVNSTVDTSVETAVEEAVDLPRAQAGANPQHLVIGLVTDYWYDREEYLPSAALVDLLTEFDNTAPSARAAIARLARRNVLETTKKGRRTYYRLTATAARPLEKIQERVLRFRAEERPWDGTWATVMFSVPDERRELRYVVRTRLRYLGYAPLYDNVWVSPRADRDQTVELLESVGATNATVLRSEVTYAAGGGDPLAAWDVDAIGDRYAEYIARFEPLLDRVEHGRVGAAEALVARTDVKESWRDLLSVDPELPETLLPSGWPGRRARRLFVRVYDGLGPLAEARVRQLIAKHDPELAHKTRHQTTSMTP